MELQNYFNWSNNIPIEFGEIFRRDPKLRVLRAANGLNLIPIHERTQHGKARHIARP
jgi:hypothetical protein